MQNNFKYVESLCLNLCEAHEWQGEIVNFFESKLDDDRFLRKDNKVHKIYIDDG